MRYLISYNNQLVITLDGKERRSGSWIEVSTKEEKRKMLRAGT